MDRNRTRDDVRFAERQTFPSWMGPALLVLAVPGPLLAIAAVVGEQGLTRNSLSLVAVVVALTVAPLPLLLRSAMQTQVTDDGLQIQYWPFHRSPRAVPFDEIDDVRVESRRSYQYGIRWTRTGWEYTPNSRDGVAVTRQEQKPVFVGSDRPHELAMAIREGLRAYRRR
ncbi:hypothetical protein [Natronoglomus mannanivorans]|uniref:PH domain-containing protein n=1 Tax=Natronoglomus mannanivorans TaxID=2979990 RepID=A0AAP2YVQ1_9EURY|nr:hypothetical protein [Halobacteria archaeon AArc-xg1-1]